MMKTCEEARSRITFYLDDELQGAERTSLENHLTNCVTCRTLFEDESAFLQKVREAAPLHTASTELRERVQNTIRTAKTVPAAPARLRERVERFLHQPQKRAGFFFPGQIVLATLLVVIAIGAVWFSAKRGASLPVRRASEFALMAADTHQRHLQQQLPLEIVTHAPDLISAWFAGKLPFAVKLPNYQESSGQEKLYRLEGARLVGYKNDYAAYVAYQMRTRPISLVITSDTVAQPSGGEEILAKGIRFHYDSIQGFKVITWSDRGLTYALVSDLEERGQQSCMVCHQGTKDRDFIESLKPR
jgi:anti-sigma factor RsiW